MANKTNQPIQLAVFRDGNLDEDYTPKEPTLIERSLSHVQARLSAFIRELATQARLMFWDRVYGTHYARIRRELKREVRKERLCSETGIYDLLRVTGHRV